MKTAKTSITVATTTTTPKKKSKAHIVWDCVRDHQPVDCIEIAERTNLAKQDVYNSIYQLKKRDLISSKRPENDKRDEFRIKSPVYLNLAGTKKVTTTVKKSMPIPKSQSMPKNPVGRKPAYVKQIDAMTIAEARMMWVALSKMFAK